MNDENKISARLDSVEKNVQTIADDCKKLLPHIKWYREAIEEHTKHIEANAEQCSLLINFICQNPENYKALFGYCEAVSNNKSSHEGLRRAASKLHKQLEAHQAQRENQNRDEAGPLAEIIPFPLMLKNDDEEK